MGLILRQTTTANSGHTLSIKGSALSYAEGDGNFVYLLTNMSGSSNSITGSTGILGGLTVTGGITGSFSGSLTGTAATASNIFPAITNNTNNYVLTATGTGTINGESNLYFDGTKLGIGTTSPGNILRSNYLTDIVGGNVAIRNTVNTNITFSETSSFSAKLLLHAGSGSDHIIIQSENHDTITVSASFEYPVVSYYAVTNANPIYSTSPTARISFTDRNGTSGFPGAVRTSDILFKTAHNWDGVNYGQYPDTTMAIVSTQDGGMVGIRTTTPSASLHVSGTVMFPNITATSSLSNVVVINTTTGQLYYTSSAVGGGASISPFIITGSNTNPIISNGTASAGFYSGTYTAITGSFGVQTTDFSIPSAGSYIQMSLSSSTGNTPGKINVINNGTSSGSLLLNTNGGSVGINTTTFDSTNPEKLLVSGSNINVIVGKANINSYTQLNITNKNAGSSASSDVVATNDTGTEYGNFINMGINSSTFNGAIGTASDAYLYNTGSTLWIGNATPGVSGSIKFFAGNNTTSVAMFISSSGNVGIGTTTPSSSLDVNGDITVKHIVGKTGAPFAITVSSGAGSGGTCSITGSTLAGIITVTTGTSPTANDTILILNYSEGLTSPGYPIISPANLITSTLNGSGASGAKQVYVDNSAAPAISFRIKSGTTGLTASSTYKWYYHVMQ